MKSFKLIRNINYNVALYFLYNVLCGVEVRALDCRLSQSGFKSP